MHAAHGKSRPGRRMLRGLLLTLALLAALTAYAEHRISESALNHARARAASMASALLHQAAEDALGSGLPYDTLVKVTRDAGGCVRMVETDALQLNRLSTQISLLAQQRLADLADRPLELPLGTALGLTGLSGAGPVLSIAMHPYGSVHAELQSAFTSAGINQTRHALTLRLTCTLYLTLPAASASVTAQTEIALAESIIVGDVPQTLLDGSGRLNLTP